MNQERRRPPTHRVGNVDFRIPRHRMAEQLARSGIRDRRLLAALAAVPRHLLIPEVLQNDAYRNVALPIGEGQTISAPGIVAAMTEAMLLRGDEIILEIGTGSGYQAAILSRLVARVISIERVPRLAATARSTLDRLGVSNVVVHLGDGTSGRRVDAPYDRIVVTAGGPVVPEPLLTQIRVGGCIVGPFGPREEQQLLRFWRISENEFKREVLGRCRFVDLVGAHGWAA